MKNGKGIGEWPAARWARLVARLTRELRLELRVRAAAALLSMWRLRRVLLQRLRDGEP